MQNEVQNLQIFKLPRGFRGRPSWVVQLWWFIETFLFHPSPQVFYGWRRFLLRAFGAKVGRNVLLRPSVRVTYPWKLVIGDHSWIGDDVVLYNLGMISVGRNAVISQRSYLCTGSHDYHDLAFPIKEQPIVVEDEAWLALDVTVMPGVTIGRGAVVSARSTVTRDARAGWLHKGTPAEPVRPRSAPAKSSDPNVESNVTGSF
ncbi:WcaF family extracellular polysaccharide biosynthesis acetyltransferase [Geminicoccus sp.]|jgi:putative colanic acid biosynthesis acetyltransferase WcaF|uniref:WcaF family extracellular polysaccharide biosynthesis acetyltransferase n=1 Tax=Geminicoccus sp. TaxID=2024832 RepID=UPI0032C231C9